MKGALLGIAVAVVFLITIATIHDTVKRAIYGDEYINQTDVNTRRQREYTNFIIHQQAADDALLEASNEQARANEARGRMFNESRGQ